MPILVALLHYRNHLPLSSLKTDSTPRDRATSAREKTPWPKLIAMFGIGIDCGWLRSKAPLSCFRPTRIERSRFWRNCRLPVPGSLRSHSRRRWTPCWSLDRSEEDDTPFVAYLPISVVESLGDCRTVQYSKLQEVDRLGPGVDLLSYEDECGIPHKVAFRI